MRRRNVEGRHAFSEEVARECGIYEVGGLLLNDQGEFTAAVEAFEASGSEIEAGVHFSDLLRRDGHYENICMECVLAAALGIPFYIFLKIDEKPTILQYQIAAKVQEEGLSLEAAAQDAMSEEGFLEWWRGYKQTVQTKGYRPQLQNRASGSYFDNLLEGAEMKWGGNIDGFAVSDQWTITAIVENRYTTVSPLRSYDPAKYFREDIYTWRPLILLRAKLDVPLLLFTYSKRAGEEHMAGLARVVNGPDDTRRLQYAAGTAGGAPVPPHEQITSSAADVKQWMSAI